MLVAWYPTRWWDWCLPEEEEMGIFKHFGTENYALKFGIVQNLCEFCQFFSYDFLDPKYFNTPQLYTTTIIKIAYQGNWKNISPTSRLISNFILQIGRGTSKKEKTDSIAS